MTPDALLGMRSATLRFGNRLVLQRSRGNLLRRTGSVALWLVLLTAAVFFLLVILHSPVATLLALAAGASARYVGQRWNLGRLGVSAKVADIASFEFDGERVACSYDEAAVLRCIQSWQLRIFGSAAACGVCSAAQHWPALGLRMLPGSIQSIRWLSSTLTFGTAALPIFVGILFLSVKVPELLWAEQVKAAVQARADRSIAKILNHREVDGLQAGVDILWRDFGLDRRDEYRTALNRYIRTHIDEVVQRPECAIAVGTSLTELARQDLQNLAAAAKSLHQLEGGWKTCQALLPESLDPFHDQQTACLNEEFEQLSVFAANRRWEELHRHAASIQGDLERLGVKLLRASASVPTLILPAGSDPYRLLGISADTPTPLIKKLRLRLAQLYHPDVSGSICNSTKMAELNAAYDAVMKEREKDGR